MPKSPKKTIDLNNIFIKEKKYCLASKSMIFLAGIFDLIFSSIPTLIIAGIFYHISKVEKINIFLLPMILLGIGFFWLIIYFIIIPYFWNGKTLFKFFFGLILFKNNDSKKIKLTDIIIRELMIIFIPWIIGIVSNLINFLVFKVNLLSTNDSNQNNLLFVRLTTTFYFIWYLFLIFGVFLDKKNQLYFDYKLNIYILKKDKNIIIEKEKQIIDRNTNHIHLGKAQPGNIDTDSIKDLEKIKSEIG